MIVTTDFKWGIINLEDLRSSDLDQTVLDCNYNKVTDIFCTESPVHN